VRRVVLLALLLCGCGAPSADLFVVTRSGADRNANLTLLVADDGTVSCNHGKPKPIPNDRLLDARKLTRDLSKQAELHLVLPPRPGSVLSYRVRMEAGTLQFADTSRPLPTSFAQLEAFTSDIAGNVCKITRR
jgi:hypothetical protein